MRKVPDLKIFFKKGISEDTISCYNQLVTANYFFRREMVYEWQRKIDQSIDT